MGRSGTSLVARLLNLHGVDLGAEGGLLSAAPDNPRGYWEQGPLVVLNDRVLAALGGTWDAPPALPDGWHRARMLEPLVGEARAMLRRLFGDRRLWGFKDPRTSLTLPLWRPLLPRPSGLVLARARAQADGPVAAREPDDLDQMLGVLALELWRSWADRASRTVALERAERALAALTGSRSWRLTRPLRAVARMRSRTRR